MKASQVVTRLVQLIATYGDKEVLAWDKGIHSIVEDYETTLVSAGEAENRRIFKIVRCGR
jgi:vacuolar-type H+-ATPase subunit B/Vma2